VIPAQLATACEDVRPATEADAVSGVLPDYVAAPASTQEASALLRAAAELGLAVVPRGAGTRLGWGAPPRRCDLIVDTRRLDAVLEHAAGDLVARVQAGVRLDRLGEVLGAAGQRLAVDPPAPGGGNGAVAGQADSAGSSSPGGPAEPGHSGPGDSRQGGPAEPGHSGPGDPGPGDPGPGDPGPGDPGPGDPAAPSHPASRPGTIGGLVATGVAGPLRLRFGSPRDLLIGITLVRADGTIARAGGKVVKNVAGYDIGKLLAGSYGTLGLITEATFRLHPRPPAASYVSLTCPPASAATAADALLAAASSALAPVAAELDWPGQNAPVTVAVALEGDPDSVAERAALMRDLLASAAAGAGPEASSGPPPWWGRGPAAASQGTVLRIAFWAGQVGSVLDAVRVAAARAGLDPAVGGSAAAGILHAALPADTPVDAVAQFVAALRASLGNTATTPAAGPPARATVVVLTAPPAVRDTVDMWGPVTSVALMRAVKDQFDPEHRLSPGRLAGGV
jgi:glycolate oxidase FAD binding subunit